MNIDDVDDDLQRIVKLYQELLCNDSGILRFSIRLNSHLLSTPLEISWMDYFKPSSNLQELANGNDC